MYNQQYKATCHSRRLVNKEICRNFKREVCHEQTEAGVSAEVWSCTNDEGRPLAIDMRV